MSKQEVLTLPEVKDHQARRCKMKWQENVDVIADELKLDDSVTETLRREWKLFDEYQIKCGSDIPGTLPLAARIIHNTLGYQIMEWNGSNVCCGHWVIANNQFFNRPPIVILNTAILTTSGKFEYHHCTAGDAIDAIDGAGGFISAVGHESTTQILSSILELDCQMNRIQFRQVPGQKAIVFKLNGRPPEGKIWSVSEIKDIGFEFAILEMTGI